MAKQDLKPVRTKEEAKKRGKNGGIASGAARRHKRSLRERLLILLSEPAESGDGDNADAMTAALVKRALSGDIPAYIAVRDSIGEKPTDKLDHTSSDGTLSQTSPAEVMRQLLAQRKGNRD